MLGERRSNSLFVPAAPAEPERKPEQAEVHDISFEERTGRSLFAKASTAPRASELFFAPQEKGVTFAEALSQVQSYLSETYATLITEDNSDAKEQMKRRMARYLQENRIAVDGMTASELVDALYTEMAEYGFLTKYIFADGIEEIDINSWRDIEIQYSDGHTAKLEEHFDSPEHAANVIRRMLQNSGKVLDNASPIITSRLAKNIRISVIKTPVLDEDAGVAASIRIVNPRNLSKADFVQSGTATEEMLDFLSACLRYGVSICVAGATSSGKTTVAGWLLSTIPDRKRIFTIEDGSRELQLIRERDGRVTNSVVHTQTRDSENERQRIDQIALLDIALRFNPDIICVGEMRGPEANAAQEAARVGIAVLTTIHSNSSEGTYRRMVSLCKRAVDTPDDTLMGYVTEAYTDADGNLIRLTCDDFACAAEFRRWKDWSDSDLRKEENADHKQSDNSISLEVLSEEATAVVSIEDEYMEQISADEAAVLVRLLRQGLSSHLTETQRRRLWKYCVEGKPVRLIAKEECAYRNAVWKSIQAAKEKMFEFLVETGCAKPRFRRDR